MTADVLQQAVQLLAEAPKEPTKQDTNAPYIITIVLALITSGGFWGVVTWLLGIRERKRKEQQDAEEKAKKAAKDKEEADRKELEYAQLLGAAQAEAQRTALLSADQRYSALHGDYEHCMEGLREIRKTAFLILDTLETIASKFKSEDNGETFSTTVTSVEMSEMKSNIREARATLYQL